MTDKPVVYKGVSWKELHLCLDMGSIWVKLLPGQKGVAPVFFKVTKLKPFAAGHKFRVMGITDIGTPLSLEGICPAKLDMPCEFTLV